MDNTEKVEVLLQESVNDTFKKASALFGGPAAQARIAEAFTEAARVLGDETGAKKWLLAKAVSLGCQIPLCLSGQSPEGHKTVLNLLGRIEYGVY
jgi:uncharacterized protein (DUF2384 family)